MSDEPENGGEAGQGADEAGQPNTEAVTSDAATDGVPQGEVLEGHKTAQDLEAVFDVPVSISAVLGRTHMEVSELLRLESGDVIELDRKVGEAIDIYVNNRLIARGEVVLVDEKLGITMTEIIKTERH
ncbi:MAG: flagellar motor switch protein FliN [Methyloligellaceae bacterium]